jgi:uncharacterized integral membrane protein
MPRRHKRDTHYESTGVWPAVVTGLLLGGAVVIFVIQNGHRIALEFLWFDFSTSPAALVLATAFFAVLASVVVGAAVRRRRRRTLQEREELERLRAPAVDTSDDEPRSVRP